MTPQISIVIPVYNHAPETLACLCSLEEQTERSFEVVVVDDGSVDHLDKVLADFQPSFPFSLVRFETNRGAPAARNEGARRTQGEYLLFLDADITLIPTALAQLKEILDQHADIDFVYSRFFFGWKEFPGKAFDPEALKKQNYIHTSALLRRRAFPGFDEALKKFQDWDLWLTMSARGSKGYWLSDLLFRVKMRETGMSHWLPSIAYKIPWPIFGWMPSEIRRYREAEAIIRKKHGI